MRSGILFEEYYLYQLYLPARWRSRRQQFPDDSQSYPAQEFLIERKRPPDFPLVRYKHFFAASCRKAKLQSVPLLAEFVDGHPDGKLEGLPTINLISKPANSGSGYGVESWRYDRAHDVFFNAMAEKLPETARLIASNAATVRTRTNALTPSASCDCNFVKCGL